MSTAYDIILRARTILQDDSGQQWTDEQLLSWVNGGQLLIASMTPDGCTAHRVVQLVAGIRQQLPLDCLGSAGVTRNLGMDGVTVGEVIPPVDLALLSSFNPGWEYGTASSTITGYFYDARTPREFVVYPPAVAGTYVEVVAQIAPAKIVYDDADAWQTAGLSIHPKYEEALLEFVLFRAYAKDSEDAQNLNRSSLHQQVFQSLVGALGGVPQQQAQGGGR